MFRTAQTQKQSPIMSARRQVRPALVAAMTLGAFANVAVLAMPLYSIQVYDRVLTSRNLTTLLMVTLITVFVLAVYASLDCLRSAILNATFPTNSANQAELLQMVHTLKSWGNMAA